MDNSIARTAPCTADVSTTAKGFALLEALVAIVVMAAVGSALFALISTGLENLQRAERHIALTSLQPDLIAWVRSTSLEELPARHDDRLTLEYDGTTYIAEAVFDRSRGPQRVVTTGGGPGIHAVALYDVTVSLFSNDRNLGQLQLRKVASRQVENAPQL